MTRGLASAYQPNDDPLTPEVRSALERKLKRTPLYIPTYLPNQQLTVRSAVSYSMRSLSCTMSMHMNWRRKHYLGT